MYLALFWILSAVREENTFPVAILWLPWQPEFPTLSLHLNTFEYWTDHQCIIRVEKLLSDLVTGGQIEVATIPDFELNEEKKRTLKSVSMVSNRLESSGSWFLISSEPMKILSRWDQVLCTSIQIPITWSAVDNFFCHVDTSCRKWAMYLDVNMFCSCT